MIERSFALLPGIGPKLEARIWSQGILSWQQFMEADGISGISERRLRRLRQTAEMIMEMISRGRRRELGLLLPPRERWRLLERWDGLCAAIDVEAVLLNGGSVPVVVSVKRGDGPCRTLVSGEGLCWRTLGDLLRGSELLVTYNGSSFDLPLLESNGYDVRRPLHIDLRGCCGRAGLSGGLKRIERQIGIKRSRELEFATSEQVPYLWRAWMDTGSRRAIELLVDYNRCDTESLVSLANWLYRTLSEKQQYPGASRGARGGI